MAQGFLLKYAEIGVKGKNRYKFEDALCDQIRLRLSGIDGDFTVQKESGRVFVQADGDFDFDEVIETLQRVFGLAGISPVEVVEDKNWDNVTKAVGDFVEKQYDKCDFSFKVKSKRSDKHYPYTSPEVCVEMGGYLLDRFPELSVDVHNPDVYIWVEIREKAYIYSKVYKGIGGMPLGTAGKAMLLLSGGIDSPVAGYMISKRGVWIDAVYFHAPPYTSERAKEKVIELASIIAQYTSKINLYIVPFTEIQLQIAEKCPEEHLTLVMRRFMMRIAERLARKHKSLALVTGESVGQVASQTLAALDVTNSAVDMPVLQPLIGMDKIEIVDRAHEIGTFETSILPYEDCCTVFTPKHPTTNPKRVNIEKSENRLDVETLIEAALAGDEKIEVYPK